MLALTLLLATHDATGSYATAGLALAGHAIALAVAGPIYGRLADRTRPRCVLLACLGAHVLAYAGLIAALRTAGDSPQLIVIAATALGATMPPGLAALTAGAVACAIAAVGATRLHPHQAKATASSHH
jgi:MFS family permease